MFERSGGISLAGGVDQEMGMTIAIDGVFMTTPQPGGYRTYTRNLVRALAELNSEHAFRILVDRPVDLGLPVSWRTEVLARRGSLGFIWREQVAIPRFVDGHDINLLHEPCATGPLRAAVPLVVTIHDTIEFTEPLPPIKDTRHWAMRMYSRFVQTNVIRGTSHLITVSNYSKRQIMQRFGTNPERITVIYGAPALHVLRIACPVRPKVSPQPGYVLGIAASAPRKNSLATLLAYALLSPIVRKEHPLVFVCTHRGVMRSMQSAVASLSLVDHVLLLERVTDEQLAALYHAAGVFVFPSWEEGFGLPPLEAMACGTPVIASDTSAIPEVLGDAAVLVSPSDIEGMAVAMETILTDPSMADSLRHKGLQRSQNYSWDNTARHVIAVYESALQNS